MKTPKFHKVGGVKIGGKKSGGLKLKGDYKPDTFGKKQTKLTGKKV